MTTAAAGTGTASDALIAHQQSLLDAIQKDTAGTITDAFSKMIASFMPSAAIFRSAYTKELTRSQDALEEAGGAPEDAKVSLYWLKTSGFLKVLLDHMQQELEKTAKQVAPAIQNGVQQARHAGRIGAVAMTAQAAGVPVNKATSMHLLQQAMALDDENNTDESFTPPEGVDQTVDKGRDQETEFGESIAAMPTQTTQEAQKSIVASVTSGMSSQVVMLGVQTVLQGALSSMLGLGASSAARGMQQSMITIMQGIRMADGWIWAAEGGACIACIEMDGSFHGWDEPFDSHPHCGCTPVAYSGPASGLDDIPTGEDWFNAQDDAVQEDILGPSKYLAWKSGDIQLMDLVSRDGGMLHERSLKELGLDFRDYLQQLPTKRELLELPDISIMGPHAGAEFTAEEQALWDEAQAMVAQAAKMPELPEIKLPGETMGYQITDENGGGAAQLGEWFGHDMTPDEIGHMLGAQEGDYIDLTVMTDYRGNPDVIFTLHSSDWDREAAYRGGPKSVVQAHRTLGVDSNGKLVMENDFIDVVKEAQGAGLGARYFGEEVQTLAAMGVDRIETGASGSAAYLRQGISSRNGFYTWARFGYQTNLVDLVDEGLDLGALHEMFPGVNTLQDLMLSDGGPAWWKANGVSFRGTFDLTEGSTSRQMLDAYLQAKGIEIAPLKGAEEATAATVAKEVSPEVKALQDQRATLAAQRDTAQAKLDTLSARWRAAVLDQAKFDSVDDAPEWAAAERKIAAIEKQQATQIKKISTTEAKMAKVDAKIAKETGVSVAQAAKVTLPAEAAAAAPTILPPLTYTLPEINQQAEDQVIQAAKDALAGDGVASHTDAIAIGRQIDDYIDQRAGSLAEWHAEASSLRHMTAINDYSKLTGDLTAWMHGDTSAHGGLTIQQVETQYAALRQEETVRLLEQVRDLGGVDLAIADGGDQAVADVLQQVQDLFPSDWLQLSSDQGEILAGSGAASREGLGYYAAQPNGRGRIGLKLTDGMSEDFRQSIALHELGHRMEDAVPGLWQLERDFYEARTAGEDYVRLKNGIAAMTKLDDFSNEYFGRKPIPYSFPEPNGVLRRWESYELLSNGLQYVLSPESVGYYFLQQDQEFWHFILGILFGAKGTA